MLTDQLARRAEPVSAANVVPPPEMSAEVIEVRRERHELTLRQNPWWVEGPPGGSMQRHFAVPDCCREP
ncbi:hypothetical protein OHB49_10955 [Streptomyces sp. NBC_01717]|uniref:hypothetical protein n=1 Tax=Streptomyces sp. NBC_01717 TaxID=2975918 RepID=UPI002E35363D|nr:hypothetical protein [Streptomyces sp. NBC_01717]